MEDEFEQELVDEIDQVLAELQQQTPTDAPHEHEEEAPPAVAATEQPTLDAEATPSEATPPEADTAQTEALATQEQPAAEHPATIPATIIEEPTDTQTTETAETPETEEAEPTIDDAPQEAIADADHDPEAEPDIVDPEKPIAEEAPADTVPQEAHTTPQKIAQEAPPLEPAPQEEVTQAIAESEPGSDQPQEESVPDAQPQPMAEADAADSDALPDQELEQQPPLPQPAVPLEADGSRYQVTKLNLTYAQDHPGLPAIESLADVQVELLLTDTGYVAPREGFPVQRIAISQIDGQQSSLPQQWFYASAVQRIASAIVRELNNQGLIGVFVSPDPEDIEDEEDIRPEGVTSLRMLIRIVTVAQMRTLGSGERVSVDERIDHPAHRWITQNSPVQPPAPEHDQDPDTPRLDLLRRDLLDEYVFRLNRHPGRRVDIAVSRAQEPGGVVLDYLVTENNPLLLYFQVSNTGTRQTKEWRKRFGVVHNQLTGNDDILSLDYITAEFDESHTVVGSYEAPFFDSDHLRWRMFGSWGEFTASDVGATQDSFDGNNWSVGGELIANLVQHQRAFLDFVAGARFEHIFVNNQATSNQGQDDFLILYLGLNLEEITDISSTLLSLTVERNLPRPADTDQAQIDQFGRTAPEKQWTLLKWNYTQGFYLEPLINPDEWVNIDTPETSTLAHEVALSFKGQHAFDDRLIPQMEQVAGGLYSVRGYRESAVAGDTVLIASLEYRFHLPRAFEIQPNPSKTPLFGKPFRFAPQQVYGRPDWDLILKAFIDGAHVIRADAEVTGNQEDATKSFIGAGVGMELQVKRNLNVRCDWGVALNNIDNDGTTPGNDTKRGSHQFHIVATLLY